VRPLMNSLASRASDWDLGSMTPKPPWVVGSASVSHLTLAHASASLPPQMKFLKTPLTWQHILGLGFQHATRCHIEASRTWFATKILPANESMLWLQLMSLPLRAIIIVSKFASGGRWKPTWILRYWVPSPLGIHLRPSSLPHSHVLVGPDGGRFVLVDFCPGCAAEGLEDLLCPVHVGQGAL
jgi:hypothetical protein